MRIYTNLCLPFILVALAAGCGDKKDEAANDEKAPTQVAAKVNGTELTVHQVNFALQRIPNLERSQSKPASLRVVRTLVDQELLLQEALKEKLDRDPSVVQSIDAARRQILAEAYMKSRLGVPAEPDDSEVKAYFDANPDLFTKRKIYRLQEISIKAPEDRREEIRKQLAGAKDMNAFGAWLKAENLEMKAVQGVKAAEQLPQALLPQLAQMSEGQALVLNTPDGVLVVVLADSQAQPATLEQAKSGIVRILQTQARQKAAKAELDRLKAVAKIEYMGEFSDAGKEEASPASTPDASETPAANSEPNSDADAISKGISGLK